MMLYPAIGELMEKVDSRYTLVVETAKRARQLTERNSGDLVAKNSNKAVSLAVEEIAEGKISFIRTKEGIK